MLRITEIKGEDIYFNNGKVLWILYFQGLSALGRAPKLPTSDLIKVGKAMGDIGYCDSDVDMYREELRFEDPESLYGCLLYTSPSPRDLSTSRMPSSA